jgi:hypothetical protein
LSEHIILKTIHDNHLVQQLVRFFT